MPKTRTIDGVLLGATLITAAVGVVVVASASGPLAREYYHLPEFEFAFRQIVAVLLGVAGLLAATFVPLEKLCKPKAAMALLAVTWAGLAAAYLQPKVAGTHRWLQLPVGSIQPSALAKITLPLALASFIASRRQQRRNGLADHALTVAFIGVTVLLVLLEPDLGSAVLLLAASLTVLVLAETPWKLLAGVGLAATLVFVVAILAKPYRIERMRTFFGESSYQVQQSLIAIGGGGLLGRGPGQSLQKLFFLPQPHTDFVFSVVGEEFGLWGTTLVVMLLGTIVARALLAAHRANSLAAALLAGGLATTLAVQTLLNISVCVKLLPAKGLPLPLLSAGGSDVAMTLVALGLLLNVGKEGS
jgi:cell division protein FtsW